MQTHPRNTRLIPVLGLILTLLTAVPAHAGVDPEATQPTSDMANLIAGSDVILLGGVEKLEQKLDKTRVRFAVQRVFKGDPALRHVELEFRGGKHLVDFTEPQFKSYDRAILYLQKDGERYSIVNGALGKKTIVNDNVYVQPDNSFASMQLKKYIAALEAAIPKAGA